MERNNQGQSSLGHEDFHFLGPASVVLHCDAQRDLSPLSQNTEFAMACRLAPNPVCPSERPDSIYEELATGSWHRHHLMPRPVAQEADHALAGARLHVDLRRPARERLAHDQIEEPGNGADSFRCEVQHASRRRG